MKKLMQFVLLGICLSLLVSGCGGAKTAQPAKSGKGIKVVATIFPEYDWVRNIMGEKFKEAEVTLLLNKGTDIHSYQPTVQDMLKIADCDVFIYVGGESDFWVEKALKDAKNKNRKVVKLMEVLGSRVKTEEVVEGMQVKKHEEATNHKHEEAPEQDEHVWLSLRNAEAACAAITKALGEADGANKAVYEKNAGTYTEKLQNLDKEYKSNLAKTSQKILLFGDRFPFRYLLDDYGIKYYAAFVGCSAETEASFETIRFLAQKVDELHLSSILTIEHSDQKLAKTISETTKEKNKKILALDSMQATGSKEIAAGTTYLKIMQENLQVLKEALL